MRTQFWSVKNIIKKAFELFIDPLQDLEVEFKSAIEYTTICVMGIQVKSTDRFKEFFKQTHDEMRKNKNTIELDKAIQYS